MRQNEGIIVWEVKAKKLLREITYRNHLEKSFGLVLKCRITKINYLKKERKTLITTEQTRLD